MERRRGAIPRSVWFLGSIETKEKKKKKKRKRKEERKRVLLKWLYYFFIGKNWQLRELWWFRLGWWDDDDRTSLSIQYDLTTRLLTCEYSRAGDDHDSVGPSERVATESDLLENVSRKLWTKKDWKVNNDQKSRDGCDGNFALWRATMRPTKVQIKEHTWKKQDPRHHHNRLWLNSTINLIIIVTSANFKEPERRKEIFVLPLFSSLFLSSRS